MAQKNMVQVQATQSFVTYVAGDCLSVAGGQIVTLPRDRADELIAAGMVLAPGRSAPETKKEASQARVVSDYVPDPADITDEEKRGTRDAGTGRVTVEDPANRRARLAEEKLPTGPRKAGKTGEGPAADPDASLEERDPTGHGAGPEGEHTDPAHDDEAAKGSYSTGEQDASKGSKPASKPVRTGQTTAHKRPRAAGKGPKGKPNDPATDPDLNEPDRSTVNDEPPKRIHKGPLMDEPTTPHPSPGTVAEPGAGGEVKP